MRFILKDKHDFYNKVARFFKGKDVCAPLEYPVLCIFRTHVNKGIRYEIEYTYDYVYISELEKLKEIKK